MGVDDCGFRGAVEEVMGNGGDFWGVDSMMDV